MEKMKKARKKRYTEIIVSTFFMSFCSVARPSSLLFTLLLLNRNIIFHLSATVAVAVVVDDANAKCADRGERSFWEHLKWEKARWKIKS